jgi:hypothetical protein
MSFRMSLPARLPAACCLAISLLGCREVTKAEEAIDWKVSWAPSLTHEDDSPMRIQPSYELEMSADANGQGPWKVVWRGTTTTATFKAPPGRRCFRAITVENGVKSEPSEISCATKPTAAGDKKQQPIAGAGL